jgi:hypothetical protein
MNVGREGTLQHADLIKLGNRSSQIFFWGKLPSTSSVMELSQPSWIIGGGPPEAGPLRPQGGPGPGSLGPQFGGTPSGVAVAYRR